MLDQKLEKIIRSSCTKSARKTDRQKTDKDDYRLIWIKQEPNNKFVSSSKSDFGSFERKANFGDFNFVLVHMCALNF